MAAQNLSRKRPAPGAEPMGYPQPMQPAAGAYTDSLGPGLSDDQFLQWGQVAQPQPAYQDAPMFDSNQSQPIYPTNQIARRPFNQVATRMNTNGPQWVPETNSASPSGVNGGWEDDLEDLEQKAQVAKREAQTKRKAIPPFVLKLRSFLDDGKNGDLIRWTDDGKSFVVLDEDEFAKKLIPELFKHNNYASFVRQLNMYGFHKKVGLSDNSMRASERKSKSPSEYSNPYFRQGKYDLMWLIQKPKNITTTSKGKGRSKTEGDGNEGSEDANIDEYVPENRVRQRPQLTLPDTTSSLTPETMQSVQRELVAIRHQQAQISKMMASLKREHEQLYSQALTFQDQHSRHENSINAILTFLATVYNKSVSGQEAPPGLTNFFGAGIPQNNSGGNVVDVGDYNFEQFPGVDPGNSNRPLKKQPLLLTDGQSRAQTMSPRSANSPYVANSRRPNHMQQNTQSPNTGQVEELPDTGLDSTPQSSSQMAGRQPQDMMSVIQNTNARNPSPSTPVADFNNVLNDLEKSRRNTPLSPSQRENVLRIINNSANQAGDNALINATPPSGPTNFDRKLAHTTAELDALAKMQAQQNQSVEKLTNLLQPLSPSGSIPGIGDGQSLPPPPIDIEDFLNNSEYFADLPSDPNFDFGNAAQAGDSHYAWDNANTDDDELFQDLPANTNGEYNSHDFNLGHDLLTEDEKGRIESVASSEVTTPMPPPSNGGGGTGAGSEFGDDTSLGTGSNTRSKGRKMSSVEDDGAVKKRRRS